MYTCIRTYIRMSIACAYVLLGILRPAHSMLIPWPKVAYVPCFIIVTNQEMYIFYVLSSTVTNVCVAKEIARTKCLNIFEET